MNSEHPWAEITKYWRQCGISVRPGVSTVEVQAFESKYGVVLPSDVVQFFATADGSSDGDMDEMLFRFWPLSEVVPTHMELDDRDGVVYPDRFSYPDCFVFADHLINSWLYAVKLTADRRQPAPVYRVTAASTPGECMAVSFREFMENYARDPASIL